MRGGGSEMLQGMSSVRAANMALLHDHRKDLSSPKSDPENSDVLTAVRGLCCAGRVRVQEAKCCGRMNRIRAANMALQFAIMPLAAFITFTTVWAQGRTLLIPSVFYALALLQLPQASDLQIPFLCRFLLEKPPSPACGLGAARC